MSTSRALSAILLGLSVSGCGGSPAAPARPVPGSGTQQSVVHRGTGDATISQTVTLPADGITSVHLYFLLAPVGAAATKASVRLVYPVH